MPTSCNMFDAPAKVENKNRLTATVPLSSIVEGVEAAIDGADSVVMLGQTPGSKKFVGVLDGTRFSMMKKSETLNPFARELIGRIVMENGGTYVDYKFRQRLLPKILLAIVFSAILPACLFLCLVVYLSTTWGLNSSDPVALLVLVLTIPVLIALFTIAFLKIDGLLAFRTEEELLDCVKRIASGATPLAD